MAEETAVVSETQEPAFDFDNTITIEEARAANLEICRARSRKIQIPRRYIGGFATFDGERSPEAGRLMERAQAWVDAFDPDDTEQKGLAFRGVTGSGKTHLAAAIAFEVMLRGHRVLWMNVPRFFMSLRSCWRRDSEMGEQDIVDSYTRADLVVVDDLGVHPDGPGLVDRLYTVVDEWANRGTKIVVTTNLTSNEIIELMASSGTKDNAQRVISRILDLVEPAGSFPVIDYRRTSK